MLQLVPGYTIFAIKYTKLIEAVVPSFETKIVLIDNDKYTVSHELKLNVWGQDNLEALMKILLQNGYTDIHIRPYEFGKSNTSFVRKEALMNE